MAIRLVIHWGDGPHVQNRTTPFANAYEIWPTMGAFERPKYIAIPSPLDAGFAACKPYMHQNARSLHILRNLCEISTKRVTDPTFDHGDTFVPLNIHEIHMWFAPGIRPPWLWRNSGQSRLWNKELPACIENVPHTVVYHGNHPPRVLTFDDDGMRMARGYREYLEHCGYNAY